MLSAYLTNGSLIVTVVESTVVVVPLTVKSPAIVTSLGKPTVIVPPLSATSTSLEVPENVIVPPRPVAVELEPSVTVIELFANLLLAIEPASCAFVIVPVKDVVG